MADAGSIRIDAAAIGIAPPRGCGKCLYRLRGLCPPCAPFALCSLCRPSERLSALSVSTFYLYDSSHYGAGATGYHLKMQADIPEQQNSSTATVCTLHTWAAIHGVITPPHIR